MTDERSTADGEAADAQDDETGAPPSAPSRAPPRVPGSWIRVARVGGVPLFVDPLLPLLLVLLAWVGLPGQSLLRSLFGFAVLLALVAVHEAAHAGMARRRGLCVGGIYLHLLPAAYVEAGTPSDEWRVALAGPVVNLVLGGLLLVARAATGPLPRTAVDWAADPLALAAGASLAMGVLNLVPVLPADGGRVVRALLEQRYGRRAGRRAVGVLGILLGGGGALAAWFGLGRPLGTWVAALAIYAAWVSGRELVRS